LSKRTGKRTQQIHTDWNGLPERGSRLRLPFETAEKNGVHDDRCSHAGEDWRADRFGRGVPPGPVGTEAHQHRQACEPRDADVETGDDVVWPVHTQVDAGERDEHDGRNQDNCRDDVPPLSRLLAQEQERENSVDTGCCERVAGRKARSGGEWHRIERTRTPDDVLEDRRQDRGTRDRDEEESRFVPPAMLPEQCSKRDRDRHDECRAGEVRDG
jgi:hypothetical protein